MAADPHNSVKADATAEEILEAQADLQAALGRYRLKHGRGDSTEEQLTRSLARLHRLLDILGRPMYQPSTHPDIAHFHSPQSPEDE